jgi:putative CocE/NonD family hydrolase
VGSPTLDSAGAARAPRRDAHRVTALGAVAVDFNVAVPMADGVELAADIFRPAAQGRYPVILIRTPYDKQVAAASMGAFGGLSPLRAAAEGYVVVVQDVRGTSASDGRLRHFRDEAEDGATTVAWAAAQEWSNGAVGMAGASYLGGTQLLAATRTPSALKAILPTWTASEYYDGWAYQGGAFQLGAMLSWGAGLAVADLFRREARGEDVSAGREALMATAADPWTAYEQLPLTALPGHVPLLSNYGDWLAHPDRDEFWRATAINERYGSIDVPALHIGGWSDIFLKGTLENYAGLRRGAASEHARANQHLLITPWGHGVPNEVVGELWLGPEAGAPVLGRMGALTRAFLDTFVKGDGEFESPPVRLFVMGANRWRDEDDWPLARAVDTRLHLRAGGRLTREAPSAGEGCGTFLYDPAEPVPTVGGNTLMPGGGFFMGPRDRRGVRDRLDVMLYTGDVLSHDLEVTGPVTATLHVATSARDTDFTVALVDVYPDGRAIGIADGILRLRYRNGFMEQRLAEPGEVYAIEIDLVATSNVFKAGHRIGVEVSSSNFPRFDRNPNHGGVIAEATEKDFVVARQHVFHDAGRPSYVTLPIVG